MTTPDSLQPGNTPERASHSVRIEQLKAACSRETKVPWGIYCCALLYGIIAAIQGAKFFMLYCGVLAVVFMIQGFNEQRARKHSDLLLQLVQELEAQKQT